jgi:hypothetical protein
MIQVIAMAFFARQEYGEVAGGPIGEQEAGFGGILGLALQEQVLPVAGLGDLDIVEFVFMALYQNLWVGLVDLRGIRG